MVGDPGVGKSRLVYEVTHSPRTDGWLVLESARISYGQAMSYWPVIELLKGYFTLQDRDELGEIRDKVTGKLRALDASLEPALPALLALLEVPVDDAAWQTLEPAQRRQRTLDAVKRLLLREARERPLLLLVEDLHWMDAETQALLDSLVESLPGARLLLLVTYRREYQHGWGQKSYYTQLRLDPLPPAGVDELLHDLLGDHPSLAPLTRLLIERAEGNPFFLEEGCGRWSRPGSWGASAGTITWRRTPRRCRSRRRCRRCWRRGSIGCPRGAAPAADGGASSASMSRSRCCGTLPGCPRRRVAAGLARLQATEFLYEANFFPELEYAFTHALTHEVAYGSLPQARRRARARAHRGGDRDAAPGSARRAHRAARPSRPAGRAAGEGGGLSPAGRRQGGRAVGAPGRPGLVRAGAGRLSRRCRRARPRWSRASRSASSCGRCWPGSVKFGGRWSACARLRPSPSD